MSNLDFYKDKFVPAEKAQIEPVGGQIVAISDEEPEFVCPKCGRSGVDKHPAERFCEDCVKAEKARLAKIHASNAGWQDVAVENGLDLWERQPGETNWEYLIWTTYMGLYPYRKPTYRMVADKLDTTISVVKHVGSRWDFTVRLQAYISHCDAVMRQARLEAMVNMNQAYIDAAATLRSKLTEAVAQVRPEQLAAKPSELVAIAKLADDMERRARIDTDSRIEALATMHGGGEAESKKQLTKKDDLADVVKILMESGALGSITQIGVRETTTRETVLVDDNGQMSKLLQD